MKKIFVCLLMVLAGLSTVSAQGTSRRSAEERAEAHAKQVKETAEQLASDFELKDAAKTDFIALYTQYQNEMMEATFGKDGTSRDQERTEPKKMSQMTDEEVTAMIQKSFERQEQQIERSRNRLAVQKKYYSEFGKTLKPKQLLKIFGQPRPRNNGQTGNNGSGRRGPGMPPMGGFGGFGF